MTPDTDVVIAGAGVAGLAAAAHLRAHGVACLVLEAGHRTGGRAVTLHPPQLDGAAFDAGAFWLHNAEANALADLARAHGEPLNLPDSTWPRRVRLGECWAGATDLAAHDAAWDRFGEHARARAAGPDISLAEAIAPLRDDPWIASVEHMQANLIAAADPGALSLHDWYRNELTGSDLTAPGGLGALIGRILRPQAWNVRLNTPVNRVAWQDGPHVAVATSAGAFTARACIVTVSTGVLAAGGIVFDPPLPPAQQAAIAALPMGLLSKVALPVSGGERFGLPPDTALHRRLTQAGEPAAHFIAWPGGAPYLVGFVGAGQAWRLSRAGPVAAEAFVRTQLSDLLGETALASVGPGVATTWGEDPLFRGAYAFARPGDAEARGAMASPVGPLLFAGEAWCTDGLAGTVGGAFNSGTAAARRALALLGAQRQARTASSTET